MHRRRFNTPVWLALAIIGVITALAVSALWLRSAHRATIISWQTSSNILLQLYVTRDGIQGIVWKNATDANVLAGKDFRWASLPHPVNSMVPHSHWGFRFWHGNLPLTRVGMVSILVVPYAALILAALACAAVASWRYHCARR